jgi:hypothetical protein
MDNKITEQLLAKIDQDIQEFANIVERPGPDCWIISLKDYKFTGFIRCEDNAEDLISPTIRMGLFVADITDISREQLLELFFLNGDFHHCNLSVEKSGERFKLFINRRIMVDAYHYGELESYILVMMEWFSDFQVQIDGILG